MNRYETLKQILDNRTFFKLVCGAGNEDQEEVRKLTTVYALAGANMFDLSANLEIVRAAKKGIDKAYELAPKLGKRIEIRPYLNVSVGIKGDPHVRKARIIQDRCKKCGQCINICRQEAIAEYFTVKEYKCIGCGDCEKVCQSKAIEYIHKKVNFEKILPEFVKEGVETMELHAVTEDDDAVFNDWRLLNSVIKKNFISICMDRHLLSNKKFIGRVDRAYKITGERLIIQADGVPMGGEGDDYNVTLQAIACADIVQKSKIPVMILLSGGTNSKTGLLAKQCGIKANGVAIGSWARRVIREFVKRDDFDSNIDVIKKAVSVAEELIKSNIREISDEHKD